MPTEENKAYIRNFLDKLYNKGSLATADECIASPLLRSAMKRTVQTLRDIFPDLCLSVEELIAEGDQVVARCTIGGTINQKFLGLTLVNRSVEIDYLAIYHLKEDRIKSFWFQRDALGILRQIGLFGAALVFLKFGKRMS